MPQLIGASFRTADLSLRSDIGLTPEDAGRAVRTLTERGIRECMVLSTCNRTEVYFSGGSPDAVLAFLAERAGLEPEDLRQRLYYRTGVCAAAHLFRVVAGMDSAVLGETEILAQFKQAWRSSAEAGASRKVLELLCRRALQASKRIRTETDICKGVTSVASLAVREAGRHGPLAERRVLILGAGKIAERVAKELAHVGAGKTVVANRTLANAERLCATYGGTPALLSALHGLLREADVVFAALATESPIIDALALDGLTEPLLLVDLGVPRNVDAKCADLPSVCLVDMEGLAERCAANSERRLAALPQALDILDEELKDYEEALSERQASGTIGALVQKGEEIRKRNLEWALPRLAELDDSQRKVVEDLAMRIVKGMLECPISELKESLSQPHERAIAARLFGLPGGGE